MNDDDDDIDRDLSGEENDHDNMQYLGTIDYPVERMGDDSTPTSFHDNHEDDRAAVPRVEWDDTAIGRCFDMAFSSHDFSPDATDDSGCWERFEFRLLIDCPLEHETTVAASSSDPSVDEERSNDLSIHIEDTYEDDDKDTASWIPEVMPLPKWVIDPIYAISYLETNAVKKK